MSGGLEHYLSHSLTDKAKFETLVTKASEHYQDPNYDYAKLF